MSKIQAQNPISGYYELYDESGEILEHQKEKYDGVPLIGKRWEKLTPDATTVIEKMSDELIEMRQAIQRLEQLGFSMELMEMFIYKKTNVNLTEIRKVLESQKQFLNEAFKKS